jgi:hypothetical protein
MLSESVLLVVEDDIVPVSATQSMLPTVTGVLMLRRPEVPVSTTVSLAAGVPLGLKVNAVHVVPADHDEVYVVCARATVV